MAGANSAVDIGAFDLTLEPPGKDSGQGCVTMRFGCILDPNAQDVGGLGDEAAVERSSSTVSGASSVYSHASEVSMALWAHIWLSNMFLSELLLHMAPSLPAVTVHEVGAGCALPAVVAASLGSIATASDLVPDAAPAVAYSSSLLASSIPVEYQQLDWADKEALASTSQAQLVLGSDVAYADTHLQPLAQAVLSILAPGGSSIIVDPGRPVAETLVKHLEDMLPGTHTMTVHTLHNVWAREAVAPLLRLIVVESASEEGDCPTLIQLAVRDAVGAYASQRCAATKEEALHLAGLLEVSAVLPVEIFAVDAK